MRLLVLDRNAVCSEGIRAIVARHERLIVCEEAWTDATAAQLIETARPTLLVIDPFADGVDGIWLIKDLSTRFPHIYILVVTQKPEEIYAERVLRAGARGYWMKNGEPDELIRSIDIVLSGERYLSPRMVLFAVHKLATRPSVDGMRIGSLTDRELHVFGLIGAGAGPGRIAGDLKLSRKTVETYQDRIKTKLGYSGASELRDGARQWVDSLGA